jgi:hypothetical protein
MKTLKIIESIVIKPSGNDISRPIKSSSNISLDLNIIKFDVPQNQRQHQHPHGMRPVNSRHRRNYAHHRRPEENEPPEVPREIIGHGHQKDQHPQAEQPVVEPGYGSPGQARRVDAG